MNVRAKCTGITRQVLTVCVLAATASMTQAAVKVWDGGTGNWADNNWNGGGAKPTIGNATSSGTNDTATINAGTVTYVPGGDFVNNSTVTVGGTGTWQQLAGNGSWIKIGDGSGNTGILNVNTGGTFNTVDAGNIFAGNGGGTGQINVNGGTFITKSLVIGAGSSVSVSNGGSAKTAALDFQGGSISVSGGTFERTGSGLDIAAGRLFTLSGTGTATFAGEFKPKTAGVASMTGGTLNVNLISFDGTGAEASVFDFGGGTINIANNAFQGIFSTGSVDYIDFTGSSGVLNLATVDVAGANLLLSSDRIRRSGDASAASDATNFVVTPLGANGSTITLVPEPASLALLGLGALTGLRRRRR